MRWIHQVQYPAEICLSNVDSQSTPRLQVVTRRNLWSHSSHYRCQIETGSHSIYSKAGTFLSSALLRESRDDDNRLVYNVRRFPISHTIFVFQYGTPLALYVFTRFQGVYEEIVQACPSGGASRNELLFYGVSLHLPFGGLGTSGYGTYHGHYSWNAFTHEFPSLYRPLFGGSDFGGVRFHPFSNFRRFALRTMAKIADVPVLNFKSTSIVMLSVLLATTVNHPWKNKMWQMLGDVLHAMADWAQSSSCVAS